MSYDARCADLARFFLHDSDLEYDEKLVKALAQDIKDAIEQFFWRITTMEDE